MTRPAKPPKSVWVQMATFGAPVCVDYNVPGWTRYDLHRPAKAKPRISRHKRKGGGK